MTDILSNSLALEKTTDAHQKGLASCIQKIEQWKKFKSDYESLKKRLTTLPDKLTYNVMVPISSNAFMPGTMVDTNRVTVLLGDNWFADVTAKHASEIAERRIQQCTKMLDNLKKEKEQIENWLGYIEHFSNSELVDIQEKYDPEAEKLWREQHAKNMKEYKQKLAAEHKTESEKKETSNLLKDYFDKFININEEDEDDDDEDFHDVESSEEGGSEETPLETENNNIIANEKAIDSNHNNCDIIDPIANQKSITTIELESAMTKELMNGKINSIDDLKEDVDNIDGTTDNRSGKICSKKTPQSEQNNLDNQKNGDHVPNGNGHDNHDRHVRWIDLSEANSKVITFNHSKLNNNAGSSKKKNNRRKRRNSSTSEKEEEETEEGSPMQINSPSDIYKCFSFSMKQSMPKSILKASISPPQPGVTSSSLESTSSEDLSDLINGSEATFWANGRSKPKLVNGMGKKFWAKSKNHHKSVRLIEDEKISEEKNREKEAEKQSDVKNSLSENVVIGDVQEHSGDNSNYSNMTKKQQKSIFKSRRK